MRIPSRLHRGFTLIELIVVIAIMVALAAVAYPIFSKMSAGDVSTCRSNLENLGTLGAAYSRDMGAQRKGKILPTSGMSDDATTPYFDESAGWWIELSRVDSTAVRPEQAGAKIMVNSFFHCGADKRVDIPGSVFEATTESISYVSWTDGSHNKSNPNSPILTTAKQDLDNLPWLSDGIPVKGKSVIDLKTFTQMVMPAVDRHGQTIVVLYAGGAVKAFEVEDDESPEHLFQRIAPTLPLQKGGTGGKKGKKGKKSAPVEEDSGDDDDYMPSDDEF